MTAQFFTVDPMNAVDDFAKEAPVYATTTLPAIRMDSEQGLVVPEEATMAERMLLQLFMNTPVPLWDHTGETITVVGVLVFDDHKRDEEGKYIIDGETGEMIPCKR